VSDAASTADVAPGDAPGGETLPDPATTAEHRDERTRPRRDKAPRSRRKRSASTASPPPGGELRGAARKAADARLQKKLAEALVFPSVPALMFAPSPETKLYLAEHFTRSGPATAAALIEASENSPELRAILERIANGSSMFTVAIAVAAYAAPPVLWIIGMRQQAQAMTIASTMTEDEQQAMMAAAYAAAQAQAEQPPGPPVNGAQGAAHGPAEAGADPLEQ
jgi:hypothetical protein